MYHLGVDPASNASFLVNELVERLILGLARGDPGQGVRSLDCLGVHQQWQVDLSLVGLQVRSMCGESLACLHPPTPHGQWAESA